MKGVKQQPCKVRLEFTTDGLLFSFNAVGWSWQMLECFYWFYSGHEFQVQIQRYNQGVPYEQRVCDRCALNNVQDEAHVILDCPDAQLVSLRNQFQHLFDAIPAGSTARLRYFINQTDAVGVADFADKCLALFDH